MKATTTHTKQFREALQRKTEGSAQPVQQDGPESDDSESDHDDDKPNPRLKPRRPLAPLPATLHPEQRIGIALVCSLLGRGKTSVYKMISTGELPAPWHDGPRMARWRAGDILAFLATRERSPKPTMAATRAPALQSEAMVAPEVGALLTAITALRRVGLHTLDDLALAVASRTPTKARGRPAKAAKALGQGHDTATTRKGCVQPVAVSSETAP